MFLTWPAFIELVMSTLFSMIDMIMVGRLSSAAISAVGLTTQPFMVLLAVFSAVNVGTTTIVAWNIGAGNTEKAKTIARQTIVLNFVMGIIVSVVGVALAHKIVVFMGAEADTIKDATAYFQIVSAGLVFQAVSMGITAALRGAGETTLPMMYNVGSNLFNVLGNYLLIFGKFGLPKLGVAGAAISTSVSRFIACVVGLYIVFFSKRSVISLKVRGSYRINFDIAGEVFSIGLPSALEQFVIQGGLMMFARTVSSLGTMTFAAHQIGLSICGQIELEDKVYTSILRFDWIGNKYIGLWGHMNPSQDVYILVDPYEKKVVNNFYGLGFTWNYEKTELFFITKGPHYGEKSSSDKIVDDDGNIYYEAENGESLLDKFSVSENGENFAFFLESDNDIKLYVTKMVDNKLEKIGEFNAPYGNIEFSDRNTLSIKDESDNKLLMSCDLANINMLYGK